MGAIKICMLPLFFFLLNFASRFTMFDGFDSIHFITKGRWENGELNEKCCMEIFFYKVFLCRQVFPEEYSYKCCGWPGPHQLHNNVLWLHPPKLRLREKSGKLTQNWPTYFCSVGNNLSLSKLLISDKTEEVWCSGQTGRALNQI